MAEAAIMVESWGPDRPRADNRTKEGRKQNRRVDVTFSRLIVQAVERKEIPDIADLYRNLGTPPQTFCIDNTRDTVLRCSKGTVIYIKANSFSADTHFDSHCIFFMVKENFSRSDMLLADLTTISNGEMIESRGMTYTEAVDYKGNKLALQNGKELLIVIPVDSTIRGAGIFEGNSGHDDVMNWAINNNSILASFTLAELDVCGNWIGGRRKKTIDCPRCKFFICRIRRVGKAFGGIVNYQQRLENKGLRQCQRELRSLKDSNVTIISRDPTVIETRPQIDPTLVPKCRDLENLFSKYGVTNMKDLIKAINRPLLDSFKVTTMEQLEDTLRKVNTRNIELAYMNRNISFDDFKYYVYNSSRLGWSNVDCFSKYPRSSLITMSVNLRPEKNVACKLVFSGKRILMPATMEDTRYTFRGVPKGENATLVAIKYEDGKPYLATKEITISNKSFDLDFRVLTLDELKAELNKMD